MLVAAMLAGPALTHVARAAATEADTSGALEEIIVTAQRRDESLSKVPVSVSVLGADTLQKAAVITESDLQINVPGLIVRATTNSNQLNYAIRGQTVDAFTGSQPAVLPYFDEIQVLGNGASSFYDLESIQVLKGPQGTLFGRNATGGAVLLTSAKPTNDLSGFINVAGGNYDFRWVQGALNIPLISDRVLLRIAGDIQSRDGFVTNLFNDTKLGDVDKNSWRVSLLVKPTDQVTNTLVADYQFSGGSNVPASIYNAYTPGKQQQWASAFHHGGGALQSRSSMPRRCFRVLGMPISRLIRMPPAGGVVAFAALQRARGPYEVDINDVDAHRSKNYVVSNITAWQPNDQLQIKNIAGYTRSMSYDSTDLDGTPYTIEGMNPDAFTNSSHQFSDELQASGKTLQDQLSYIGGIYYATARNAEITDVYFFDVTPIIPATEARFDSALNDRTTAGYAQVSYNLGNATGVQGLSVSAGGRYTQDKLTLDILPSSRFYDFPGLPNEVGDTFDKVSWQFGVQEQLDPDLLLYVTTRRSFRSGGFNPFTPQSPGTAAQGGNEFLRSGHGCRNRHEVSRADRQSADPLRLRCVYRYDRRRSAQHLHPYPLRDRELDRECAKGQGQWRGIRRPNHPRAMAGLGRQSVLHGREVHEQLGDRLRPNPDLWPVCRCAEICRILIRADQFASTLCDAFSTGRNLQPGTVLLRIAE